MWNTLNICPSGSTNGQSSVEKSFSVTGTGNLSFTVQIAQGMSEIALDQPQTVNVKRDEVTVFQFIAPQGISSKQLDITAMSRDSDAAYLKVSQTCEDIQENIEVVDYKKESLRLSFATKGRITLSKVSVPPLTDSISRWFIGIKLKNASGDVKFSESKHVTLKLTSSFDYDYATPICTLFFVSLLGGLFVSVTALVLFKECLVLQNKPCTTVNEPSTTVNEPSATVNEPSATVNEPSTTVNEPSATVNEPSTTLSEPSTTVNEPSATVNEPSTTLSEPCATVNEPSETVITNKNIEESTVQELTIVEGNNQNNNWNCSSTSKCCKQLWENCPMLQVAYNYWFSLGPKTYSYITGIVGSVLMVGAFQFVFANWYTMIQEGDRDNCYYNDFCYRVSHYHDIPLNLMISNLTYIIHGVILFFCVWWLETKLYLHCESNISSQGVPQGSLPDHAIRCPNITLHLLEKGIPDHTIDKSEKAKLIAKAKKKKYSYSIGYAFSWALLFEGLFSTLYHFCPSRFTFQFDSAFMFIISGLTVLLLYNGIEQNRCPYSKNVKYPVGATNFFLFFIVPLFIFNYFGSLYNSESGMAKSLQGLFFACLLIWWLSVVLWAFYKLNMYEQIFQKSSEPDQPQKGFKNYCNAFFFIVGGLGVPPLLFGILLNDLSQVFLFSCIVGSVAAVLAKTNLKSLKELSATIILCCKKSCCCCPKEVFQAAYIFATVVLLFSAVFVFNEKPTTDKASSPENSRDKNEECLPGLFGFFDWHDLWHFLSSFALLMGAFVIMFVSAEPVQNKKK